jgi:DNA-binding response OmpR family regulator
MSSEQSAQPRAGSAPLVAVINSSVEIAELLKEALEDEGFAVVVAYTVEFKRGGRNLRAFFEEHRPRAVLWDIAIPYAENWDYFSQHVLTLGLLPEHCFVCTTVNKTVLDLLVGTTGTLEVVGRPFDLSEIVDAVRHAVEGNRLREPAAGDP